MIRENSGRKAEAGCEMMTLSQEFDLHEGPDSECLCTSEAQEEITLLPMLVLSIGSACLLVALAITLLISLKRLVQGSSQFSQQTQYLGQLYQERTEIDRQNLAWMQRQLHWNEQMLQTLQDQVTLMRQTVGYTVRPVLAVTVEKVDRQRYTMRIRNEGLGPALTISYAFKDGNLRTFDVSSQLDHEFLGAGGTAFLQMNMLGLPLPHDFLVLRYSSMAGEKFETHLTWKKGILASEYRVVPVEAEVAKPMPHEIRENRTAGRELAG